MGERGLPWSYIRDDILRCSPSPPLRRVSSSGIEPWGPMRARSPGRQATVHLVFPRDHRPFRPPLHLGRLLPGRSRNEVESSGEARPRFRGLCRTRCHIGPSAAFAGEGLPRSGEPVRYLPGVHATQAAWSAFLVRRGRPGTGSSSRDRAVQVGAGRTYK